MTCCPGHVHVFWGKHQCRGHARRCGRPGREGGRSACSVAAGQRSGGKGGQSCAARATPRWLGPSVGTGDRGGCRERWLVLPRQRDERTGPWGRGQVHRRRARGLCGQSPQRPVPSDLARARTPLSRGASMSWPQTPWWLAGTVSSGQDPYFNGTCEDLFSLWGMLQTQSLALAPVQTCAPTNP